MIKIYYVLVRMGIIELKKKEALKKWSEYFPHAWNKQTFISPYYLFYFL